MAKRVEKCNLNGRHNDWFKLAGAGQLVWPTGADTRRKHARQNLARFVVLELVPIHYKPVCTDTAHDRGYGQIRTEKAKNDQMKGRNKEGIQSIKRKGTGTAHH